MTPTPTAVAGRDHPDIPHDRLARYAEAVVRSPAVSALVGAVLFLSAVVTLVHVTRQQMLSAMSGAAHAHAVAIVGSPLSASAECEAYGMR